MKTDNIQSISNEETETRLKIQKDNNHRPTHQAFKDNFEHLRSLEEEAILYLMAAEYEIAGDASELISTAQGSKTVDEKTSNPQSLATVKKNRMMREAISKEKGIALSFDEVASRYRLDDFERDILMLLFVYGSSPAFKILMHFWSLRLAFQRFHLEV